MGSVFKKNLVNAEKHNVGSLNQWEKELLNQGAKVEGAAIDNYCLGELGFNVKGERTVKHLTDKTKKGVLVASVEDFLSEYETISQFYNDVNEWARVVYQTPNHHIECSNYKAANAGKEIKVGQKAHYDTTEKKYVVSNDTSDHADYATAGNKYLVVAIPDHTLGGQSLIRFEIV